MSKQNEPSNTSLPSQNIGEGEFEVEMVNFVDINDMNEETIVQEINQAKPSTSPLCKTAAPKWEDEVDKVLNTLQTDPATWDNIDDEFRQDVVQYGPTQISNFDFPLDNNRRKFSVVRYKRRLVNGECLHREWLIYSTTKNAVFCFCRILFSSETSGKRSGICGTGVSDWKNISAILASHVKFSEMERIRN